MTRGLFIPLLCLALFILSRWVEEQIGLYWVGLCPNLQENMAEDVNAAFMGEMLRRRGKLWGEEALEAAALAAGSPCASSHPAAEFPTVPACGNNGAEDACPKVPGAQPFAKYSLPKIDALTCTRPLAPRPAMSLLWLRPGDGGPRRGYHMHFGPELQRACNLIPLTDQSNAMTQDVASAFGTYHRVQP
jgi:hypothetical protein